MNIAERARAMAKKPTQGRPNQEWVVYEPRHGRFFVKETIVYGPFKGHAELEEFLASRRELSETSSELEADSLNYGKDE